MAGDGDSNQGTGEAADQSWEHAFKTWREYEKIAIHFNDLLMKLRVQALGGVAAIAAVSGIVLKDTGRIQWGLLAMSFLALIGFWIAVWILDRGYYQRLLYGAVDAIIGLEAKIKTQMGPDVLDLSTRIEKRFGRESDSEQPRYRLGPTMFYSIVIFILALLMVVSCALWYMDGTHAANPNQPGGPANLVMPKGSTTTLSVGQGDTLNIKVENQKITIEAR